MKILFLTNNTISKSLINWIRNNTVDDIVIEEGNLSLEKVLDMKRDFIISYNYVHIITEDILKLYKERAINLHISYLPWNRGAHPNVWSFIDETPKGITIHLIDKGLDTGDVLIQKEITIHEEVETLSSSYKKLHKEIQNLFIENWLKIKNFQLEPTQQKGKGSYHSKKDFNKINYLLEQEGWDIKISELKRKLKMNRQ